jgi:type I restriction enzyme M protein
MMLKQDARAAVIVPDNVLFEAGTGRAIRRDLMEDCDLHTILRLPNGIFYSHGVNTNVLFFTRRTGHPENSAQVRIYDMRTAMPRFGRTRKLAVEHFAEFIAGYREDLSDAARGSRSGRWRVFSRSELVANDDNLDLVWMSDRPGGEVNGGSTQELLASIMFNLQDAMTEIELLADDLAQGELDP